MLRFSIVGKMYGHISNRKTRQKTTNFCEET
jgi:hypothetical protein